MQESDKNYPLQTHLKLVITLQVRWMEREPPMISDHLVVGQKKSINTGLVRPFVAKILLVVHLLNLSLQNQPIPNAGVCLPWPIYGRPILKESIIPGPQSPSLHISSNLPMFCFVSRRQPISTTRCQASGFDSYFVWAAWMQLMTAFPAACGNDDLIFLGKMVLQKCRTNYPKLTAQISWVVTISSASPIQAKALNHFWSTPCAIRVSTSAYISSCTSSSSGHGGSRRLFSLSACAIRAVQSAPRDRRVNFTTMQKAGMMYLITLEMTPRGNLTPTNHDQKLMVHSHELSFSFNFFFAKSVCTPTWDFHN